MHVAVHETLDFEKGARLGDKKLYIGKDMF
jgi:hypothetical protein